MEIERRAAAELTATGRRLSGRIAYGGAGSSIDGLFVEVLAPLSLVPEPDVLALYEHRTGELLGRSSAKTLVLDNTAAGLGFSVELPPTRLGDDVAALVARGDLRGASFGFVATRSTWSADGKTRTVEAARLHEVSVVALPAHGGTSLALRSRPSIALPPHLARARRQLDLLRLAVP